MTLSKSQYIRGLQCHKSLWLYKNRQDLRDTPDNQTESSFNTGYDVGALAKELFRLLGHRTNAYYLYKDDGTKPTIPRGKTFSGRYGDLPLTIDVIQKHLDQEITIGILPHNLDDECIFLAFDLDYHKDKGDPKSRIKTNPKNAKRIRKHLWNKYKRSKYGSCI